ncbi:hypothetical protein D3C71_1994600 [compost metagenome]
MYNFFSWRQYQFIHIRNQSFDIASNDFIITIGFGKYSTVLNTFDVLASNSHIHHFNIHIGLCFGYLNSL